MAFGNGPRIVTNGLVLSLDAADQNSYVSGSATWRDLSGNTYNAALKNNPTFSSANLGNFQLDGIDDYFYVSGSFPVYTNFTIVSWIKISTLDNHRGIFSIKNAADANDYQNGNFAFHTVTGSFFGMEAQNLYTGNTSKNNTAAYNTIAQCILVCDQTNLLVTYYLNGVANGTQAITSTYTFNDHNALFIGCRQYSLTGENNGQNFLPGNIYHISFYTRALSAAEVLQNYNAQKSRFNLT
jgi:hypothetical protein